MKSKKNAISVMFLMIMLFTLILSAKENEKVILAKFDGGVITKQDLDKRLKQIPPMYQYKFNSPEGKKDLLNNMCSEEVFYKEAQAMDLENSDDVKMRVESQITSKLAQDFKSDYVKKNLKISKNDMQDYFLNHSEEFPGKSFDEVQGQIERKISPEREKKLIEQLIEKVSNSEKISTNNDVIDQLDFQNISNNEKLLDKFIITSKNPSLALSVKEFVSLYKNHPRYGHVPLKEKSELIKFINKTKETNILAFKAREAGYDKKPETEKYFKQIKRSMILRTAYNKLVIDKIDTSDESLKKYYDENIKEFSSQAYRIIRQFVFNDEKTAKKVFKKAKKARKDSLALTKIVEESSLEKKNDGVMAKVFDNGIVPGIGKDEVYSRLIWETKPHKFSKIFQNVKDKYVFFLVQKDVKAVAKPFEEVKNSIKRNKQKTEAKRLFDKKIEELYTKYNLKQYPEKLIVKLTAEEYFNKAEEAQKKRKFKDAIYYYDQVYKFYKNGKDDYKALFMKGFLLSEELKEKDSALEVFDKFLKEFPKGELNDSAIYMKKELQGKNKTFEELKSDEKK